MTDNKIPNAIFKGQKPNIDWRKSEIGHEPDNDEELHKTPKDVKLMLGFDPKKK